MRAEVCTGWGGTLEGRLAQCGNRDKRLWEKTAITLYLKSEGRGDHLQGKEKYFKYFKPVNFTLKDKTDVSLSQLMSTGLMSTQ